MNQHFIGKRRAVVALCLGLLVVALGALTASADAVTVDFESFALGTVDGQDGWQSDGAAGSGCALYDHAVVNNTFGFPSFGAKSLRISNAVTSGCFSDQTFSKSTIDEAGETSAANDGKSGGTRQDYFEAEWDFASTVPGSEQTGLSLTVSPDRGDGARMSWVQMADKPSGLEVNFYEYDQTADPACSTGGVTGFVFTNLVSGLDRTVPHTIKLTMNFVDGVDNDIVRVYVDGNLEVTGGSWEDYFRDCEGNPTRTVDSLLFRTGGAAAPATAGYGFAIDNLSQFTGAEPCTTVCYADAVGGNDANGGTSAVDAKKTIQAAVNAVNAGGQVIAAAGVYAENVTIPKSLTLTGAGQTNDAAGTVLEGTGLSGSGIFINNNVVDVTVEHLRVQNYNTTAAAGVYGNLSNHGLTVQQVTTTNNGLVGQNGGGVYMNGPVDDVLIDNVTATNNRNRGIVIWNGFKTNITLTNNTVTGNNCCGIELQDGTASGVTVTGNTVSGNADSGMAFTGLMAGAGPNLISGNTLSNNGRFGVEIKLPNGTGLATGDGSIVVENNNVSLTVPSADLRDFAGIAVFRRGYIAVNGNVNIPTGVIVRNNTVSGYAQNNVGSNSEGFGIVVEGTNMTVTGNTLTNNEVGAQTQGGHLPYVANTGTDGDQSNLADQFFGRGNSPVGCAAVSSNTFSGNTADFRTVGTGGGLVRNIDTGETFCTIQAAINDADTVDGHTIDISAGTFPEAVAVNKEVTLIGDSPTTTIIDPPALGNGLTITKSNVSIKELRVTGAAQGARLSGTIANITFDNVHFVNNTSRGIEMQTATTDLITNVQVLNSLFDNNNLGIRMASGTRADGITIADTTFQNHVGSAFQQSNDNNVGWVKNLTVRDSTFTNNGTSSGSAGIYAEEFSNVLIEDSAFTGNWFGINLWDYWGTAASTTANVVIQNNTFTDHKATTIALRSTTGDPNAQLFLVDNNTINQDVGVLAGATSAHLAVTTSSTSANGAVDVVDNEITFSGTFLLANSATYGVYLGGRAEDVRVEGNTIDGGGVGTNGAAIPSSGIRLATSTLQTNANINITKNLINNFVNGVSIHDGSNAFGGVQPASVVKINRNDLSANTAFGIQSGPTTATNGKCNWWGSASGPGPVGPGSGSNVSANVTYAVWLFNNNLNGGNVTNIDTGEVFCSIQEAIDDSDTVNGHTIVASAGVYQENVNVNKSVTLNGANAGVSPNDPLTPLTANAARGPESELAVTGGGIAFRIQAPNVTIDGFKFTDSAVGQPDIQVPLIGAGWNYGGDAPGFKVVNNLFSETSRVLVYSNGSQMAGGTIDDNRVQDPGRADTGCGTTPTLPATNCGYQLFNPWRVDGLSFQGNVTVAAPGSNDRIRTLNIFNSTDVTVADNTIRNTCIFACFNIGSGTSGDVEVTGNDIVTDVGNAIQIHSSWATTGATINVHHNILTTGNDFPIVVDALNADLDNVHINRNSITGGKHVRNGKDDLTIPGTETLDTTCNWWQSAAGPTPANFFGPVSYTPWLYTDDLDGPCFIGGTITVAKVAAGGGNTLFGFDPSWSTTNFTLADGGSQTSPKLQAGSYSVAEVTPLPTGWSLQSATCDNATTTGTVEAVSPSAITVADNDAWVCTFTNVYTPPPTNVCNVEDSSALWTDIIGKGMGNPKKHKNQVKLNIPNYAQVDSLYGQMVAKNTGAASYVRFILPGKNNYVQVDAVTSPADHAYGNFWYGEYIDPAKLPTKSVAGRWFLQKSGTKNHIPRALVLYPTYESATNTYVNIWNTYDAAEGEAYWDTAGGWTATRVITESIAPPNGPTTFNVELAVVDNDKDARPIWVTVEAGGVTQTQMPNNPSDADQLNLMTFTLANVPAGTDEITITVYSPSLALDGVVGDSAALVGMRANYMCAPLN